MKQKFTVSELVPHSDTMSLLTRIIDYGEDWLTAEVSIDSDTLFLGEDGVPAWIGMEYMAQAIAAFSGLQERLVECKPKLGFLLGTRKYSCNESVFPLGCSLLIRVERVIQGENGLSAFKCTLKHKGLFAEARLNVFQPENAEQFLQDAI